MRSVLASASAALAFVVAQSARADTPMGTPPPEATAIVAAPATGPAPPQIAPPDHETTATVSAGGMLATGNSQQVAATVNGKFDMRRGPDAVGASLVGNYGESAPAKQDLQVTTENLQGRLRYERYVSDRVSLFLIGTARHDRFQGLDVRFNADPGVKYLFLDDEATKLWGELGYDFQYDIRRSDALLIPATATAPASTLDKTASDHSGRFFAGFRHAFSKDVTFSTGVEYLQSFVHSKRARINWDVLLAAGLGAGLSVGVGFSLRYDNAPLATVTSNVDTATTVSLIYALSDIPAPPPPPPPPCHCPEAPPPAPALSSPPAPAPPPSPPAAPPPN